MKIKILTECGENIGYGHLTRCISLYEEAKKLNINVELITFPEVNWHSENYIKKNISKNNICIIDSYIIKNSMRKLIANLCEKVLYIDDLDEVEYPNSKIKGIVVNPSLCSNIKKNNLNKTYLKGSKYIMIRPPFLEKKKKEVKDKITTIGIIIGGTDIRNISYNLTKQLNDINNNIIYNIVSSTNDENIKKIGRENNINILSNLDGKEMRELIDSCDLVISGGGQILFELITTNTPFIPIEIIDNQKENIKNIKKIKEDIYVGNYKDENLIENIIYELERFHKKEYRKNFINYFENIIDGEGSKRIIKKLVEDQKEKKMININGFEIGGNSKTFIIAELSANHGQNIENALKSIKKAKEAGADAIKIQTYTADTLTIDSDEECFKLKSGTIWDGKRLYDLYKENYTPWEWHKQLFDYAKEIGITMFSTPFDKTAVDFLEKLEVPAYKIASFEIVDQQLIKYVASKGKPIIISTGIASYEEIEDAVRICKEEGNDKIILLKCTSSYPAKPKDANLKTIKSLKDNFGVIAGLSDHTLGTVVAVTSVALGSKIIEKHFIIDKNIESADATFSLDENEFKKLVLDIREAEKSLGIVTYEMTEDKIKNRKFAKSLFFVEDIEEGEVLTNKNVRAIRPSDGILPKYIDDIIGKKACKKIKRGTPVQFNLVK